MTIFIQICLSGPLSGIFDNFETIDNPSGIYKILDANIKLPNKILFTTFLPFLLWGEDDGLFFVPDSGIRVDSTGISKVVLDTAGLYYIYYTQGPNQGLAISGDGLNFSQVNFHDYPDYRSQVMPDSSCRRYFVEIENDTAKLRSRSSDDGIEFTLDLGHRFVFPSNDAVTTPNVYTTYFNNALGEVYMVYLSGEIDNAPVSTRNRVTTAGLSDLTLRTYLVIPFWAAETIVTGILMPLF